MRSHRQRQQALLSNQNLPQQAKNPHPKNRGNIHPTQRRNQVSRRCQKGFGGDGNNGPRPAIEFDLGIPSQDNAQDEE